MTLSKFGKKEAKTGLGEAIRKIRIQTLTSQKKFGQECGVCFRTVCLWEQGKAIPTPKHANAIVEVADEYDVRQSYIDYFMIEYSNIASL